MSKTRKVLAVLLSFCMVLGMMSGMSLSVFADGETKAATTEFIASEYSAVEGVNTQGGMFFPGQAETTQATGIANLRDGNWARYDNVVFSGDETAFSFDYSTQNNVFLGAFQVYLDEIKPENLIVKAKNLTGGEWNWPTVRNYEVNMTQPVEAGTYSIYIVGLEPTVRDDADTSPLNHVICCGIRSFHFVEGEWPTITPSTTDVIATTFNSESGYAGTGWRQSMSYENGTGVEGMHGLRNGNWLQYDNISFTGKEETFSIDYTHNSENTYGNFEVYIVNDDGEALIAKATDVNTGAGWTGLRTVTVPMEGPVVVGTYSVKIKGLPMTVHNENTGWTDANTLAGFYAFRFIEGEGLSGTPIEPGVTPEPGPVDPDTPVDPGETEQTGRYFFADSFTGAGTVMTEDAANGVDPGMPSWIGNLYAGAEVTMPDIPFTEDVEYLTLYSRYQGVQVDIYADSVSDENKIATIKNSRPNFQNRELAFFEGVTVPLEKKLDGLHNLIFVVANGTDLGAFKLLTAADALDMQSAPVNASKASTTWKDLTVGAESVSGLQNGSVLVYELVNLKNATGVELAYSKGNGSIEVKAYDNEKGMYVEFTELSIATSTTGATTVKGEFDDALNGAYTLLLNVKSGYNITVDSIQLTNDFKLVDTAMYDAEGNYVSLKDVDFEWNPGTDYTFTAEVSGVTEGAPQLIAAIYDAEGRVLAANVSGKDELSTTLTVPADANLEGAYTVSYIWDSVSQMPLANPVKAEQKITIGCVGDSITQGAIGGPYIPYMETRMPDVAEIMNFGVGGATVDSTISGFALLEEAMEAECSVYTILLGTNEVNNRVGWTDAQYEADNFVEKYKAQYRTLIGMLLDASPNAKIVLATCAKVNGDDSKNAALQKYVIPSIWELAEEYGFDVIDVDGEMDSFLEEGHTLDDWGYGDALHMSSAGAEKLGIFFAQELNRFLGL